jgi:hypothetical protein
LPPMTTPARLRPSRPSPHPPVSIEPSIPYSTGLGRGYPWRWRTTVNGGAAPANSGHLQPTQARYELHRPQAPLITLACRAEMDQRGLAMVALNSGEARSWRTCPVWWPVPARLRRDRTLCLWKTH